MIEHPQTWCNFLQPRAPLPGCRPYNRAPSFAIGQVVKPTKDQSKVLWRPHVHVLASRICRNEGQVNDTIHCLFAFNKILCTYQKGYTRTGVPIAYSSLNIFDYIIFDVQ